MLALDLAKYLSTQGVGLFEENGTCGDIFVAGMPDLPDDAISIYPTGGYRADTKLPTDHPTIMVMVRGASPLQTMQRAQSIYDLLQGLSHQALESGGTFVIGCQGVQSGPNYVAPDENGRHQYSLNFVFHIYNSGRA